MTTAPDYDGLSYGRYLQACRLEKGMSMEMLANETRISVDTLAAIENEDYFRLPKEVYAKGFLRSFAKVVGADDDYVIQSYVKNLANSNRIVLAEKEIERENARFWKKALLSAIALLSLIALTLVLSSPPRQAGDSADPSEPAIAPSRQAEKGKPSPKAEPAREGEKAGAVSAKTAVEETPKPSESGNILLEIKTVEQTWVKIVVDNQKPKEYTLRPGDHLAFEATSGFNILIGNATGVQLFKNGQPVNIPGKQGQVVNLEIP
ncbi:MAG: DUF4115 domain-containing protein [Thermodesulfobacteriota bacterium]|nr:DUF4115 domain-containing protein [Thermodesulfobacteriota bacterium]